MASDQLFPTGTALSCTQANKNRIRESIKELFPDRDCFTLVRPVNDERELSRLDTVDPSRMRPEVTGRPCAYHKQIPGPS